MSPLDAFWHALNFFAPALGVSALAAAAVKLLWRRELASVSWLRLLAWGTLAGVLSLVAGLLAFGRDGTMASYGALVVATALALWGAAFLRR